MIIIARDELLANPVAVSAANFLDAAFPVLPKNKLRGWTNDVYMDRLCALSQEKIASSRLNPIEFLLPYCQLATTTEDYWASSWNSRAFPGSTEGSDLSHGYRETCNRVDGLRENLKELQRFTPDTPSELWMELLEIVKTSVSRGENRLENFRQTMNYNATLASLEESRQGIEYTRLALIQNNRVKRLTQLAFLFIPLSTIASLFGMNITALNSGAASIWMVVVAAGCAYIFVVLFWWLLSSATERKRLAVQSVLLQKTENLRRKLQGRPIAPSEDAESFTS